MKGFLYGIDRSRYYDLPPGLGSGPRSEEDRSTAAYVLGVIFVVLAFALIVLLLSPRTSTSSDLALSFFAALLGGIGIASILGGVTLSINARERKQNISPYTDELIEELYGAKICEHCGNLILPPGSSFCSNCGASVPIEPYDVTPSARPQRVDLAKARYAKGKRTRICMVCNLNIEPGELRAWCPQCGRVAHREHLLIWVRERKRCPMCGRHIEEKQLRKQLFQVKR